MLHKSTVTRLLLALTLALLVAFAAVPALANSYNYDVTSGGVLTVNVGDTIYMTNSHSTSGMAFHAYGWSSSNNSIVQITNGYSSRSATMQAVAPGTVTIKGELTGSFPIENQGSRYNSATDKWETYTYITHQSYNYPYGCNITVTDTIAPQITAQPKDTHAPIGGTVTFSMSATDHSALSYQWYYIYPWSSTPIAGGTGATWSFAMKENLDGIAVYCVAKDSSGNSTQSGYAVGRLLGVSKQPANGFAYPGGTISTSFTAYGNGLKYNWYYKDPGMSAFQPTSVATTTANTVMSAAKQGRLIFCRITDQYGNTIDTNTIRLSTLAITQQPKGGMGTAVTTTVKAVGDGVKYQWYYKDYGASAYKATSITNNSVTTVMNSAKNGRQVYCKVTDQYGHSVNSSAVAMYYFAITQQPTNGAGIYVATSIKAVGDGLTYRWYYKDPGMSAFKDSYLTSTSVTTAMNAAKHGRQLYCKVTDKFGHTLNSNVITLSTLAITKQPTNGNGSKITTSVQAVGDGLKYQWFYKDPGMSAFQGTSVTTPSATTVMSAAKHGRQLYCKITDKYGYSVTSNTIRLATVAITQQPKSGSGSAVTVSVKAVGDGLKYRWYYKDPSMSAFQATSVTTPSATTVMNASKHGRQLYCVVTDQYGNSVRSSTATLHYLAITQQPSDGNSKYITTSVKAFGDGLTYRWYYKDPGMTSFKDSGRTTSSVTTVMNAANIGRQLYCKVTDQYGFSVNSKVITLRMLTITQQPKDAAGTNVSVFVKANGDGLTYQWYYKNADMTTFAASSVTTDTYECAMSSRTHLRQIYCVVTDAHGNSVQSNTATLYQFGITTQPKTYALASVSTTQTFSVSAVGEGLKYQWYWAQPDQQDTFVAHMVKSSSLSHTITEENNGCAFYCVVTDKYGHTVTTDVVYAYLFKILNRTGTIYLSSLPWDADKVKMYVEMSCPMKDFQWYIGNESTGYRDRIYPFELDGYTQTENGCYFYVDRSSLVAGYYYECYYYNKWSCYSAFRVYIKK